MSLTEVLAPLPASGLVLFRWDVCPDKVQLFEVGTLRRLIADHLPGVPARIELGRAHPLITTEISLALSRH